MKILLVKNDGAGFADYMDVRDGITVSKLFSSEMSGQLQDDFMIRVNRETVPSAYKLQEGDRVTFTPTNIEGA